MSSGAWTNWNIPAPAPARSDAPQAPGALSGGGCGFDWSQVRYEEFSSNDPQVGLKAFASQMPAVLSRPPKTGFFWIVIAASWGFEGANVRNFGMFLVPPDVSTPDKLNGRFRYKDTVSGVYRSIPMVGIRIRGASASSTNDSHGSSFFSHASEFAPSILVVPPNWALLVAQDDPIDAPGSPSSVSMQVAYAELPIGSDSPGFGG